MSAPRLELVWPNKDKFLLVPRDDNGKPVWVDPSHPAAAEVRISDFTGCVGDVNDADPYADNLLFTGDSLDVLRILNEVPEYRRHYRGKVKLVYIDPPFNTGQAFTHYDDWMEHSTWLSFMRDRLLLIKELLTPDGSVWVHLDDVEVHRMRCLMDEVFGAQNFVTTVVWQKRYSRSNDAIFSACHDTILVYSPKPREFAKHRNRLGRDAATEPNYKNPDSDPDGPWRGIPFDAPGERGPNLSYGIQTPSGEVRYPPSGRHWASTEDKWQNVVSSGRALFGKNGAGSPQVKRYLSEMPGLVPDTVWLHGEVGHNDEATRNLQTLFDQRDVFDTPKPERLLERIIHIATNPGDVVFDAFGGSLTSAAVAHKMGRRWLTCEVLPETVEAFGMPRMEKVVSGADRGGISESVKWSGGGGFRTVTVGPSMYEVTPLGIMLADWATNGRFARAVAGQLGFEWQPGAAPFCGQRGRMRLAVLDGAVGLEEAQLVLGSLDERERVTIVGKVILPGVEEMLAEQSRGSRVRKAPRDLLADTGSVRRRRRDERNDA